MNNQMNVQENSQVPTVLVNNQELDIQINTAKAYPRSVKSFLEEAKMLATANQETAASCFYSLPRKDKNGKQVQITGPSIRLAEIAAYAWGNLHAATRIIENNGSWVTAEAVAWDLEKNVKILTQIKRSIKTKDGRPFSADMQTVTANAAASLALRNAILRVVPRSFIDEIYAEATKAAIGDATTISKKVQSMIAAFSQMGAYEEQVLKLLGKSSLAEVNQEDLITMHGIYNAIKDGTISVDEVFFEDQNQGKAYNLNNELKEKLAGKKASI